eukprot:CAMPEP_0195626346 /NCGR_PEP_ID=MMETSP0815-20121206/18336_1 /TAXON_ID=97485 /ORGANISM="Prymnesium parvum, Strain Texoma1" /LENGTH=130 /DNA_ID=CAMNT_0040767481 /DNA_START=436 /DNA_END=825 /DNA_ORIENTATION=+
MSEGSPQPLRTAHPRLNRLVDGEELVEGEGAAQVSIGRRELAVDERLERREHLLRPAVAVRRRGEFPQRRLELILLDLAVLVQVDRLEHGLGRRPLFRADDARRRLAAKRAEGRERHCCRHGKRPDRRNE